eukprot:5172840-Ditylum_brightwellii.AAC.1
MSCVSVQHVGGSSLKALNIVWESAREMAVELDNALSCIWIRVSAFGRVAKLCHSRGSAVSTVTLHNLHRNGVYCGNFSPDVGAWAVAEECAVWGSRWL